MHGIHLGDFPTWIAVFFAAVGGTVALIQLRQQGNVLKGEVERNKRRDELLDGQLSELRERALDRAREQAEHIVVVGWEHRAAWVRNNSGRPITKVAAGFVVPQPDGGVTTYHPSHWQEGVTLPLTASDDWFEGDAVKEVLALGRQAMGHFEPDVPLDQEGRRLVRFNDDAGRRWQLDKYMHLEPAPDDGW